MASAPLVFISYRRADCGSEAGRLSDLLEHEFGSDLVFMDAESIRMGSRWPSVIDDALARAVALIVMIGKSWLVLQDSNGRRRLDAENDWVRREIQTALSRGIPIFPVCVQDAGLPSREALPSDIAGLAEHQVLILDASHWRREAQMLVEQLAALGFAREKHVAGPLSLPVQDSGPGKLPRATPFVGRQAELGAILETFRHPRLWLTAIEGIAGIGKTSVAIQAAHEALALDIFERVVFVSARDSDISLLDIVEAISVELEPIMAVARNERVSEAFEQLARTRTLLVLDNFETVVKERESIHRFLLDLPSPSKAVVTSRRLETLEAVHVSVPPMIRQDGRALLAQQWLLQDLQGPSDEVLDQIREGAGGNPQFMKLAVAQLRLGTPLERVLSAMSEAVGAPFRFYDELWATLDSDARLLLQSMTRFASPATWQALLGTTGLSEGALETAIEQAVRMFLVELSPDVSEEARTYTLHPLTRNFVSRRLAKDPNAEQACSRNFVQHFLGFSERHGGRVWSNYQHLQRERRNIFAALDYLAGMEDWDGVARIAMQIRHFIVRQETYAVIPPNRLGEYFSQALYVCRKGSEAAARAGRHSDECRFLVEIGNIHILRADLEEARTVLGQCLQRSREYGLKKREIMSLRRLGHIDAHGGEWQGAREHYAASLALARGESDSIGIGRALRALGDLSFRENQLSSARELYRESLEYLGANVDPVGAPRVVRRIGSLCYAEGLTSEAIARLTEAVGLYMAKHDRSGASYSAYGLALAHLSAGTWVVALRCLLGGVRVFVDLYPDIWRMVMDELHGEDREHAPKPLPTLELFVPPADTIIKQGLDTIRVTRHRVARRDFDREIEAAIAEFSDRSLDWEDILESAADPNRGRCGAS